jgi:mannosyl-oligosaccharide alpha-1,2-mannosidase
MQRFTLIYLIIGVLGLSSFSFFIMQSYHPQPLFIMNKPLIIQNYETNLYYENLEKLSRGDFEESVEKAEGLIVDNGEGSPEDKVEKGNRDYSEFNQKLGIKIFNKNAVTYDPHGEDGDVRAKRNAIRDAFIHAYGGYESKCFGRGEVKPFSGGCHEASYAAGLQMSLVDSLDTILLMGLGDFYQRAKEQTEKLTFTAESPVSLFEVNIRLMGGLLSAYGYTHEKVFLDKAIELGDKMLIAFDTPTGFPKSTINFGFGQTGYHSWASGAAILSEIGTLQLEFIYLSHVSNNTIYAEKVLKIFENLKSMRPSNGLYPVFVLTNELKFRGSLASPGALGDSFYEYLFKLWLFNGKKDKVLESWFFQEANDYIDGFGHSFSGTMNYLTQVGPPKSEMEHLSCFAGGMFALASVHTDDKKLKEKYLNFGKGLGEFCYKMYSTNPTGLSGESYSIGFGGISPVYTGLHYIMRPEAIESWFYLWRVTKDPKYREWGWNFFESIEKHTKGPHGYGGLRDSRKVDSDKDDVQQSWFLAETLKYLFLLFTPDDVLPLDEYVFNTEAHPLPMIDSDIFLMKG